MRRPMLVILAAGSLAACASKPTVSDARPDASPIPAASLAAAGKAQDCLQLQNIRESRVIDDKTIDFILRDGRVMRNTLPYACSSLGFEKAFSYATSLSQLCSVDIITVIYQSGGVRTGPSCGLGKFVPVPPPAK